MDYTFCCDLLENYYLCSINNSSFKIGKIDRLL